MEERQGLSKLRLRGVVPHTSLSRYEELGGNCCGYFYPTLAQLGYITKAQKVKPKSL